jgi:transposase-like protein
MAQAIYQAADRRQARVAFRHFQLRWQREYPSLVRQFQKDLPNLLLFFSLPKHLRKQLRTTNIIERCLSKCGENPTDGLLCERAERGQNNLFHLPWL